MSRRPHAPTDKTRTEVKALAGFGIREDEMRRVSASADAQNIIYPLVDLFPSDKIDVLNYMKQFSWDLTIPEHLGNCTMCFKKSYKKLNMVYRQKPEVFEFTDRLEQKYSRHGHKPAPRSPA